MEKPFTPPVEAVAALPRQHPTSACPLPWGALGVLLHVLIMHLLGRAPRRALRDWYPTPDEDSIESPAQLRAIRRLRAWIGWILRGKPARGMALTRSGPAPSFQIRNARAPPRARARALMPTPPPETPRFPRRRRARIRQAARNTPPSPISASTPVRMSKCAPVSRSVPAASRSATQG